MKEAAAGPTGSAESDELEALSKVLDVLHADVVTASVRKVTADIRALEFASSSCLKAFVTWLQRVQELDDDQRYVITFRSSPRHSWQRRSLAVLAAFASGVVRIDAEVQ